MNSTMTRLTSNRNRYHVLAQQRGGTLLGLIIGLVVGLAIAVIVALMITKSTTPFTNKLGTNKSGDAPVIQMTDPNKPLYGNAAKEALAAKPAQNDAPNMPADKPADKVSAPSAPKVDVKTDAKTDNKPDVNVAAKSTEVAKKEADDKAVYFLQVGAFRESADAESVRAKLALLGIESHISQKNNDGDNLIRVRVGHYEQLDALNKMRSKLAENSIDVAVIKTPK